MKEIKRTLKEFSIVLVIGLIFAVTANAINNRGLKLTRNYFTKSVAIPTASRPATTQQTSNAGTTAPAVPTVSDDPVVTRLRAEGIGMMTRDEVQAILDDPGYESGVYLIVDARNDEHYTEGHIPGAYQLYHGEVERHIEEVRPLALKALKVVVYCGGGPTCEDSVETANDLVMSAVDRSQLFVYTGGMTDWLKNGRRIEKGQRGSGVITEGKHE